MRQRSNRPGRRKRGENGENGSDRWLVTYADLITLLLIFFVMMFAMSHLDNRKYEEVTQSLQTTFKSGNNILDQGSGIVADKNTRNNPDTAVKSQQQQKKGADQLSGRELAFRKQEQELQNLMKVISTYVKDNKLEDQVFVADQPQGISITLSDKLLFDVGKADLKPGSMPVMDKLASLFKELHTIISIEGHTDSLPIVYASKYKDNWELSGARALSVLRFFIDQKHLSPEEFQYAGYSDTRPAANNSTEAGRQKNRRVEIIVLRQLKE
ncbi:flagellar motor protein MotB [Paenibacillus sp.]|jgi:chemotaxis protein MotB|uniref:flagellar motor protein MotB n=1 Tax=Paenibacillus sp. TaxID=58172 RepID=UPI00282E42EB|nr:flagellar motor protein MotB [Paenibacillus sp.]MDR0267669.1 OmpA family protein [Paenibacillus sp.]